MKIYDPGGDLVSVVIPTYNRATSVCEAINSVLCQDFYPTEIIVVDDGSTDNTKEILANNFFGKIVYIFQKNTGVSGARNTGIRAAKGNYIAFLDSDDLWLPGKLAKQIALFQTLPENVALVHCSYYTVSQGFTAIGLPKIKGNVLKELLINDNRVMLATPSVVIRRKCIDSIGLFDESLIRSEDKDFWIRLARHYEIDFIEEPLVVIRRVDKSLTMNQCEFDGIFYILDKVFNDPACPSEISSLKRIAYAERLLELMYGMYCSNRIVDTWKFFLWAFYYNPKSIKITHCILFLKAPFRPLLRGGDVKR